MSWEGHKPSGEGDTPSHTHPHLRRLDPRFPGVYGWLAVWLSGNALASINVVALRQARLVLGWVTVCGRVNHFGM